jgi:hypothetical protein
LECSKRVFNKISKRGIVTVVDASAIMAFLLIVDDWSQF